MFCDDFLLLDVLLERQQDLRRVYGFDEVVGNLRTDGLLHDVLLLALRDHHDRRGRQQFLHAGQRLEAAQSGHILVEEDEVESLFRTTVQCIVTVRNSLHLVTLLLEEEYVGFQKLNLIVNPKQFVCSHRLVLIKIFGIVRLIRRLYQPKGKSSSSSVVSCCFSSSSLLSNSSGSRISKSVGVSICKSSGISSGAKCWS